MTPSIFTRELHPCILARLACPNCGPVRMALPPQLEPITTLTCPYCDVEAPAEPLGTIQTVRDLPFFHHEGQPISERQPPQVGTFARLQPGQILVYCEEVDILHLAALAGIYTSLQHLGPNGIPSISFMRNGEETGPVPHASAAGNVPPYWCTVTEAREAMKAAVPQQPKVPRGTVPEAREERRGVMDGRFGFDMGVVLFMLMTTANIAWLLRRVARLEREARGRATASEDPKKQP